MNILLTSVSTKVSLVKAFRKALTDECTEGKIIGIDIERYSAALYFCDNFEICPRMDEEGFLDFISGLCERQEIKLIVPTRDADVAFFSEHKDYLEKRFHLRVMVGSPETVAICNDKLSFFNFLRENNLPLIESWSRKEDVKYPCIIKEISGAASENVFLVNDETELDDKLPSVKNPIFQEYVRGVEYTIDYFADFDSNPLAAVPRIRHTVKGGESKVGITVRDERMVRICEDLGRKLKLVGHNVIQCFKLDDDTIKLLEVNPRYGGGSNLSFAAGVHTPTILLRLLSGRKIGSLSYKENFVMLRYSEDLFMENDKITNIRHG